MLFKIGTFCLRLPLRILGISQMLWWGFYLVILIVLASNVTTRDRLTSYVGNSIRAKLSYA